MFILILFHSRRKKNSADNITTNSDIVHAIAEPIAAKLGTRITLAAKPTIAPKIELIRTAVSFPIGIRD